MRPAYGVAAPTLGGGQPISPADGLATWSLQPSQACRRASGSRGLHIVCSVLTGARFRLLSSLSNYMDLPVVY